jgi:hypothetical protein
MGNDWLETLRRKQQRATVLRAELAEIEAELRDARAILSGRVETVVVPEQQPKSRHGFTRGKRAKPIQEGSSVWWARQLLQQAGHELVVDELLAQINDLSPTKVQKPTLVSNLSRYVKHGDTFTRPAPSTYGLIEWDQSGDEVPSGEKAPDLLDEARK